MRIKIDLLSHNTYSCPLQAYEDMKACHRQARISGISSFIVGNDLVQKFNNNRVRFIGWVGAIANSLQTQISQLSR